MPSVTRKLDSAGPDPAGRASAAAAKRARLTVFLVTGDDSLWPQIGTQLTPHLILRQVDSLEELFAAADEGQAAIVLWDARGQAAVAEALSRLQLHSARFAVVALDHAGNAPAWTQAMEARQVVAHVAVPVLIQPLNLVLESAEEEVAARTALLGGADNGAANADAANADAANADSANGDAANGDAADAGASGAPGAVAPARSRKFPRMAAGIAGVLLACAAAFILLRQGGAPVKSLSSDKSADQPAVQVSDQAPPAPAVVPPGDDQVDVLIDKARQAMLDRHFIDPAEGSALALYRSALLLDPDNGEARQGLQRLAEILFARAQSALDERKIDVALQSLETARSIDPADGRLSALDERIAALRAEFGPAQILAAISAQNFDRAAQLIDEAARAKSLAATKLSQLREELRRRQEEVNAANKMAVAAPRKRTDGVSAAAAAAAVAAVQHDPNAARSAPAAPAPAQFVDADALRAQILEQAGAAVDTPPPAKAAVPEVVEASLTRVKGIDIDYPVEARRKNIEGWVELSFMVTAEGKVTTVAVLNSSPKGMFDAAAAKALARARYQPPLQGGKATAVTTKIRIAFRMADS